MENILGLVDLIYEAVADASRWQTFLDRFVHAVRARRGTIALMDSHGEHIAVVCWYGWPDEDIRLFNDRYAATDPWGIGGANLFEGEVAADFELCQRGQMEQSVAFREYYLPRDCVHGMGGVILVTPNGRSGITVSRGAKEGPFGEPEKAVLRALMPRLRRAALLHGQLGSMRSQLATFTGHLDPYPHAFLLIDSECRVLYSNSAAREIADRRDGLEIDSGRISLQYAKQNRAFQEAVSRIASSLDTSTWRLEVSRPSQRSRYRLMLMPVGASGAIPLGVSVPAVTVLIIDRESQPEPDPATLRELFSLTPAEARVAAKLVQGRSVEEIAAEAKVSLETIRTHIKRLLSKTATNRQRELVSLILRSVPFRRQSEGSGD